MKTIKKYKIRWLPEAANIGSILPRILKRLTTPEMAETCKVPWSLPGGGINGDLGRYFIY